MTVRRLEVSQDHLHVALELFPDRDKISNMLHLHGCQDVVNTRVVAPQCNVPRQQPNFTSTYTSTIMCCTSDILYDRVTNNWNLK